MPTSRETDDDFRGGGPGWGHNHDLMWADVNWSYTEPTPTGIALGFEVVVFTGSDPNTTDNHLRGSKFVPLDNRRCILSYTQARGSTLATVNAAVRVVYPWAKSAWATSAASTSSTPPGTIVVGVDNLIPNPTSELGVMSGYGGVLVVSDAGNSYAGTYCRKLNSAATNATALTGYIACIYGDQFSFNCYVKGSTATPALQIVLKFLDASFGVVGTSTSAAQAGTTYTLLKLRGAVPAGAVYVQAFVQAGTTSAATFLYIDNLSLRRSITPDNMDGDGGFRVLNGHGNTGTSTADRVYYRGNNDPATLGGAPAIATLTVNPRVWDTTNKQIRCEFKLQPTASTDNLDGMRYIKVDLYRQSVAGTTATVTSLATFYVPVTDRLFNNTTDNNAANAVFAMMGHFDAGINAGFPAMICTLYNALGPSNANAYYSAAGWTAGTALTNNGTAWPAGITGGGTPPAGGGGGGGGACPAPWIMVDLPHGEQLRADQVEVGTIVQTIHPGTGTIGGWPVSAVSTEENDRWDVWVQDREEPYTFAPTHPFRTENGWTQLQDLVPGDTIVGEYPKIVERVTYRDHGTVIKLTVDMAHSYQTDGMLSSNIKN